VGLWNYEMAFLITWTTHNSWLPGDPRGFRTRKGGKFVPPPARYADGASEVYDPKKYKGLYKFHSGGKAVNLSEEQRRVAADTVIGTIEEICPGRWALCVGEVHVHVLVELGGRATTARFCHLAKGRSASRIIALGHKGKVWSRRYHARHFDSSEWNAAKQYVLSHNTGKEVVCENGD
jgi:REP element-mobilizing transposase RayT